MARLIRTDGTIETLDVPATGLSLATLQQLVGGYIEMVSLTGHSSPRNVLVVNEDGHRLGLPLNPIATLLYQLGGSPYVVVGDVVVCTVEDPGGDGERFL
jgi:hypothetical protein